MTTLIPLSSLADPAAFLQGARVPLVQPSDAEKRWECIAGMIYEQMGCSFEAASEYDEAADQDVPSSAAIRVLALDPFDPDVARLCDRRIAEALHAPAGADPVLVIHRKRWYMDVRICPPHCYPLTVAVKAIPTNAATVRAALVLALYGRTS